MTGVQTCALPIYISFKKVDSDEVPALSIDVISNGFLNWDAFNTGQQIWNRNDSEITANYTLMSFYEQDWTNTEQKSVILEITPHEAGDFYIQFRGTFTEADINTHIDEHPNDSEGDDIDQQGWPVFQQLFRVGNVAPVLSLNSFPIDYHVNRIENPTNDENSVDISWIASDPDDNAHISLFYGPECNEGQNPIVADLFEDEDSNNYLWNTTGVPAGRYRVWGFIYDTYNEPVQSCAWGHINIHDPLDITISPSCDFEEGNRIVGINQNVTWEIIVTSYGNPVQGLTVGVYTEGDGLYPLIENVTDKNGHAFITIPVVELESDLDRSFLAVNYPKEYYYKIGRASCRERV